MHKYEVNKTSHTIEVLGRRLVIYPALLWYGRPYTHVQSSVQTALRGQSCLKIAELKNFALYDLCSVTRSYPTPRAFLCALEEHIDLISYGALLQCAYSAQCCKSAKVI